MLLPVGFAQVGKINATKHKVNHVYKSVCARALIEYIWKRRKKTFRPGYWTHLKIESCDGDGMRRNFLCLIIIFARIPSNAPHSLSHTHSHLRTAHDYFFRAEKVALRQSDILLRILCVPHANLKDSLPSARFVGMRVAKILLKCFPIRAHSFFLNGRWAE